LRERVGIVTSGDLVPRRSSPRIKRLPWADLGSRSRKPCVPFGDTRPRTSGRYLACIRNQVEEIE
jgi:hypothetical protein